MDHALRVLWPLAISICVGVLAGERPHAQPALPANAPGAGPRTAIPSANPTSTTPAPRSPTVESRASTELPRVRLSAQASHIDVGLRFGVWRQADAEKLTAAQASTVPDHVFTRPAGNNLGLINHAVWVRIRLQPDPDAPDPLVLELGRPIWTHAQAFLVIEGKDGAPAQGVEPAPLKRLYDQRHTAFKLPRVTTPSTLLLRLEQHEAIAPVVRLWQASAYEARTHHDALVQGLFFGLLLALLLYNGALFLSSRDPAYAAYVLWQAGTMLYLAAVTGIGQLYVWPGQYAIQALLPVTASLLMCAGGLFFVRIYLLLAQRLPYADLALALLQWFCVALALVRLIPGTTWILLPSLLLIAISAVAITLTAALRTRHPFVPAGILLVSSVLMLASGFATLGRSAGLFPENVWTTDAFEWVAVLLALLLSFGLSIRIAQMRERTLRLQALTMQDPLTGLNNRTGLFDAGSKALERTHRSGATLAVLWLDLDGLKRINDVFGHAAGDALIQAVAQRIEAAAGRDAVCARLGGDEFAVLLPNLPSPRLAEDLAAHLLERLRAPYVLQGLHGQPLRSSASIGIASDDPALPCPLETLMLRADTAMYRAKSQGRDTYVIWTEAHAQGEGEQTPLFQFTRPAIWPSNSP